MTHAPNPDIAATSSRRRISPRTARRPGGFAGVFGKIAASYFQRHGDQSDALAMIAAKNHKNGARQSLRPDAQGLGFAFCRRNRTRTRSSPDP
jgi:acetyl-CoA C-acetyltransferase